MIAPDHDRRLQFAALHHLVECQARKVTLTQTEPANPRRQTLESNAVARHVEPVVDMLILREQLLDLGVGLVNILRIAGQRNPAKRSPAFAKHRPNIGRHEAGEVERIFHAGIERDLADIVAIVDGRYPHRMEIEHGLHVHCARLRRLLRQLRMLRRILLRRFPLRDAPAERQVAVDQVVRRSLVGHQVRFHAAGARARNQLRQDFGRVAEQADRHRLPAVLRVRGGWPLHAEIRDRVRGV